MFRTALLSVMLALAGYAAAAWLTHGFQIWTAEGARRLEVALQPVPSPAVSIDGPGIAPQALSQYLADGQSVTLVDFVYTRCQTVCLAMLEHNRQARGVFQLLEGLGFHGYALGPHLHRHTAGDFVLLVVHCCFSFFFQ